MEDSNKVQVSDQTRELFRSSAVWMRTYAIIMIILISLVALAVIILIPNKGQIVLNSFPRSMDPNATAFIKETIGIVIIALVIFVLVFGYAASKLLGAANSFTAISYNADKDQLIKAFKSLKLYWQFYGITLVVIFVFLIYFVVRMINLIVAAS